MLNQTPMLNPSTMEVSVGFGRIFSPQTVVICFFTDPIQHGHRLRLLSHKTLLTCLKPGVKGAIAVITE